MSMNIVIHALTLPTFGNEASFPLVLHIKCPLLSPLLTPRACCNIPAYDLGRTPPLPELTGVKCVLNPGIGRVKWPLSPALPMSVYSCLLAYQDRFNRALSSVGLIQLCNNKKYHFHLMSSASRTGVIRVSSTPDLQFF